MSATQPWTVLTRRGSWTLSPRRDAQVRDAIRRTRLFVTTTPDPVAPQTFAHSARDVVISPPGARRSAVRALLLLALLAGASALSACNTVDGAGEDLQDASRATEDAIDDATD